MWSRLRLRTRFLLGYTPLLVITIGLALYMIGQIRDLSASTARINEQVSARQQISTRLTVGVADLQQALSGYLIQPTAEQQQRVRDSISAIGAEIAAARKQPANSGILVQLRAINASVFGFEQSFQALVSLLESQERARIDLIADLSVESERYSALLPALYRGRPEGDASAAALAESQRQLQIALSETAQLRETERQQEHVERATTALGAAIAAMDSAAAGTLADPERGKLIAIRDQLIAASFDLAQIGSNIEREGTYAETLLTRNSELRSSVAALALDNIQMLNDGGVMLEQQSALAQSLGVGALALALALTVVLGIAIARTITRPLLGLVRAAEQIRGGSYDTQVQLPDGGEIGSLATAFNQMSAALASDRAALGQQRAALTERNSDLERALAEVHAANEAREQLAQTIRTLSVPVLPILPGVLHVPLVGEIDPARADALSDQILRGVEQHRARHLIIDVTGVPLIDGGLAGRLLRIMSATRLLGAECTLVGVGPEVAQTLVAAGVELGNVQVQANLQSAVARLAAARQR